ncbi:unnamed protein product [Oppiella nova]|uniref:C2H2-type domain-containing protein n=1 Tax=Oppiella nova TaxID=334625 RepID=A0A7R9MEF7_9ACAR|nr:unnamed protein product [Oppiella nova]CAG2175463.1 unnamed protein product [Oppiella nova]
MAHIRITHTKEKPFPCDVCDERFATKFFLKRHQLTHPSAQSLTCDYTDCAFETLFHNILTAHMKGHDLSPQFPCDESGCDRSFYTLRALKQHKSTRIHNPDFVYKKQKKLHVCYWIGCAKSFQSNHLLVAHIRLRHTNEKPFKCDECGKEFAIDLYLRKHQKLHSIDKQFKCEYNGCSYETSRKADFDSHVLRHTGVPTVKCDEMDCNKSFYTVNALKVHKKTTHRDDRPLACNWPGCEARFKTRTAIRRHKNIHLGVPKYRCDIEGCRKSFVNPGYLRQHEREHTKPFVCSWPACERRYGSNDRLVDHQNAHLDLRANKCPVSGCDRSFFSKPSVRQHLRQVHKYAKTDGLLPITKR